MTVFDIFIAIITGMLCIVVGWVLVSWWLAMRKGDDDGR